MLLESDNHVRVYPHYYYFLMVGSTEENGSFDNAVVFLIACSMECSEIPILLGKALKRRTFLVS